MSVLLALGLALVVAILIARAARQRSRNRVEASLLASTLIPEIRAILQSSETPEGAPPPPSQFALTRQRLPRFLQEETLFAVETFYQCVDAFRDASDAMRDALGVASDASLGDRIRAKDRRDRCLKDVYYTGEAAIEKLSKLA